MLTSPSRSQVGVHSTISQKAFAPRGPLLLVSSSELSVFGQHGGPLVSSALDAFCTRRYCRWRHAGALRTEPLDPGSCSATGPCTCANVSIPNRSRNAGRHRTQASTTPSELGELMETLGHGDYQELDAAGTALTSQVSTSHVGVIPNHGVRLAQSRRRPSRRTRILQRQRASLHTHADHARISRRDHYRIVSRGAAGTHADLYLAASHVWALTPASCARAGDFISARLGHGIRASSTCSDGGPARAPPRRMGG